MVLSSSHVHALDDEDLIRVVVASPVPVAVALGHAPDDLVLGRVADANFATPTAFGVWFRKVVEVRRVQRWRAEGDVDLHQGQELAGRLLSLQRSAARWRLVAVVAVIALTVVLGMLARPS